MSIATIPDPLPSNAVLEETGPRRVSPVLRVVTLLVLGLVIVAFRIHTRTEPPECDLGTYAVIGHELLRGRALYSDLWDIKPPTIYATYAVAELFVGYGQAELLALGVVAALVTLIGVERAGESFSRGGGLWAAAFWAVACSDPDLQANQPNSEVFINALMVWAFVALSRISSRNRGSVLALVAGILLAIASTYKQVVVFVAFSLALAHLATIRPKREAWIQVVLMALPGLILWVGMGAYFAATGRYAIYWRTNFLFSTRYSGNLLENVAAFLVPSSFEGLMVKAILIPLGVLSVVPFLIHKQTQASRGRLLLAAWIAGTLVAVAAPGRFWPHYYQLWLPPLAVGAGWGAAAIVQWFQGRERAIAWAPGLFVLANCLWIELPHTQLSPELWSFRKYGNGFIESEQFGRTLAGLLNGNETFYQWGPHPEVYFASGMSPPVGVLWDDPLYEGPMQEELSARTLADLKAHPPELIAVYKTERNAGQRHAVLNWIASQYRRVPGDHKEGEEFPMLYVRPAGSLEARLKPLHLDAFRDAAGGLR